MFRTVLLSALGAGLAACVAFAAVQHFTTVPMILHAEVFEDAGEAPEAAAGHEHEPGAAAEEHAAEAAAEPAGHVHDAEAWQPADGLERTLYTWLADLVIGVAVALVLVGLMVLKGDRIDARRGALWGVAGFAAAALLPGLGLPPELPGTAAAELGSRQAWWLATVVLSGAGIALLAFGASWIYGLVGLVLIVAPHVVGAPEPPTLEASYPAGMAGEFVVASLVASAVLWTVAGAAAGWLHDRLSRTA